ncbi:MAG: nitrogen fixation protein NifZ [Candidatus Nitrospinota bacterium M3_3B_026]
MEGFEPGEKVRLLYDIKNDGTVFGKRRGEQLERAGAIGFVKRRGRFLDDIVYDVHFLDTDAIIGLREKELIPASARWRPARLKKGGEAIAAAELRFRGRVVAGKGARGTIGAVRYHEKHGYVYEVKFHGAEGFVLVTESQVCGSGGAAGGSSKP